jgi:hypothetical protein
MNHMDVISPYSTNSEKRRARFSRLKARKNAEKTSYRKMRKISPPSPKPRKVETKAPIGPAIAISDAAIENNVPPEVIAEREAELKEAKKRKVSSKAPAKRSVKPKVAKKTAVKVKVTKVKPAAKTKTKTPPKTSKVKAKAKGKTKK